MRKLLKTIAIFVTLIAVTGVTPAQAAARQIVIVVADAANPQVIDFGTTYLKKAFGEEETTALERLKSGGKAQPGGLEAISLNGVLKIAAANGYKTGVVTNGDVAQVAPSYYGISGDAAAAARELVTDSKFDFLAGGGRSHFISSKIPGSKRSDDFDASKTIRDAGGTVYYSVESLDEEARGRVLALQSEGELSYAIDRPEETQAGFEDLVTLALDTLAVENNAPFVLVVHDTLLAKSLAAKDTPAVVEQYHAVDNIVDALLNRREDNPDLSIALIANGGTLAPRFTSEKPDEQANTIFIVSNLPLSYSGAGAALKGANDETLTAFADEQYKGWKIAGEDRSGILAGTRNPEAAIRASYEPAIKIGYDAVTPQSGIYAIGLTGDDLKQAITTVVSGKPGPSTVTAESAAP